MSSCSTHTHRQRNAIDERRYASSQRPRRIPCPGASLEEFQTFQQLKRRPELQQAPIPRKKPIASKSSMKRACTLTFQNVLHLQRIFRWLAWGFTCGLPSREPWQPCQRFCTRQCSQRRLFPHGRCVGVSVLVCRELSVGVRDIIYIYSSVDDTFRRRKRCVCLCLCLCLCPCVESKSRGGSSVGGTFRGRKEARTRKVRKSKAPPVDMLAWNEHSEAVQVVCC